MYQGKLMLITGAYRGIGKAIALEFAKNGYDVIINYKNDDIEANKTCEIISNMGVNAVPIKCDISKEEDVKEMYELVKEKFNHLDCLINNAGIANDGVFFDKTKEDFVKVYETNLVGPFLCAKYFRKIMDKKSSIVNISSTNGIDTYYTYSADYDASKAALISLSNNLAVELAPIRVNTICPGWVNTEMNKELDKDYIKEEEEKILLKRFADPEEIGKVAVFLCGNSASYINKSIIRVDGGFYG
jgi:3-oxoacyl-[acyl-carrier protein] reductase